MAIAKSIQSFAFGVDLPKNNGLLSYIDKYNRQMSEFVEKLITVSDDRKTKVSTLEISTEDSELEISLAIYNCVAALL